ncbi:MAG: hypothetical protein AB7T38_02405 [Nitrospirales bacterium]
MGWYTGGDIDTSFLDEATDNAGSARTAILAMATAINAMKAGPGSANGVASLNGTGQVPEAQLALACLLSGNLAGLANAATARQNLGATSLGAGLFTAANVAAAQALLGFISAAGGTFSGAPKYAADPGDQDTLARRKYVDDGLALKNALLKVFLVSDDKEPGQNGGTYTAGDWRVRDLNTELFDPGGVVAVGVNTFTLLPGSYVLLIRAPAHEVGRHVVRLWNITDSSLAGFGGNARSLSSTQTDAWLVISLGVAAGGRSYRVEHRGESTKGTDGFGVAQNFTAKERYTMIFGVKYA